MKRSASSPFYKPAKRARIAPKKASNVAKTVRATMRRMATKNRIITQHSEVAVQSTAPGAITNFIDCSTIPDSVTPAGRTSGVVSLDKIRVRGHFYLLGGQPAPVPVRLVVGYIRNQVAPGPTFTMFESADGAGAARTFTDVALGQSLLFETPLNPTDFTVLYDKNYIVGSAPDDGRNFVPYDITLPLKGRKIHFQGNTEGPGNQDLQLVVVAWTADPGNDSTAVGVEWTGVSQLWYTDKI